MEETPTIQKQTNDVNIKPSRHLVLLRNCDYTEGMTVADVLTSVFSMTKEAAYQAMMAAHQDGQSVIVSYGSKDLAETKCFQANNKIKEANPEYTEVFVTQKED